MRSQMAIVDVFIKGVGGVGDQPIYDKTYLEYINYNSISLYSVKPYFKSIILNFYILFISIYLPNFQSTFSLYN